MKSTKLCGALLMLLVAHISGAASARAESHSTSSKDSTTAPERTTNRTLETGERRGVERYDADNSGINIRDRSDAARTPLNQSERSEHIALTKSIRSAITNRETLSTAAHNVKVITDAQGNVYLRGPVESENERTIINDIAMTAAGEARVFNQLEVKRSG